MAEPRSSWFGIGDTGSPHKVAIVVWAEMVYFRLLIKKYHLSKFVTFCNDLVGYPKGLEYFDGAALKTISMSYRDLCESPVDGYAYFA